MKITDLRGKTPDQLQEELIILRKEQLNFRFQKSSGALENTGRVRSVRRDIARVKTILSEVKSGAAPVIKEKAKVKKTVASAQKKKNKE